MSKFKEQEIDLGVIKSGSNVLFNYESIKDIKDKISYVEPGCGGCTKILGYDNNLLKVKFVSGDFPIHIDNDRYSVTKVIRVYYKDGTNEELKYKALIFK